MREQSVTFNDAEAYERFMGRWSRAVGEKFLDWLAPPAGKTWLDAGCGTGAFSELIFATCAPAALTGIDPAPAQIAHAQKQLPQARFQVADALALPFGEAEFDIVASALVLHFLPDRRKALAEMRRVLKAGGTVAGYTWNRIADETFAPYAPMARALKSIDAEVTLSPLVPEADTEGLRASLEAAGFRDIVITMIEASRAYRDFEEFWAIQTTTFHPVGKSAAKLDEAEREKLRAVLRQMLPPAKDGSVSYSSRAIAYKARKA